MPIPDGAVMDGDRIEMRAAAGRLLFTAECIAGHMEDSSVVWGLSMRQARALEERLRVKADELEDVLDELRTFRESVR